jgi:pyruvate, orthophosphate dikinase
MDPQAQLWGAIEAVWKSWTLKKAVDYRKVNGIPHTLGTGVNIVSMVFGNMGDDSGTGVAFTRDPSTGEPLLRRVPGERAGRGCGGWHPHAAAHRRNGSAPAGAYEQLLDTQARLEQHFRDMQDIEFTVERGTLYPAADAHRQAHDGGGLAHRARHGGRGVSSRSARPYSACSRISSTNCCTRVIAPTACHAHRRGAAGQSRCGQWHRGLRSRRRPSSGTHKGEQVILSAKRPPEDFHGIVAARAVLTARGGMTSHAAVVARGMGKCAIVGARRSRSPMSSAACASVSTSSPRAIGSRSTAGPGACFSATSRHSRAR